MILYRLLITAIYDIAKIHLKCSLTSVRKLLGSAEAWRQ
ncbi:uncharacterized protein METZ01_LOCUS192504 [marine metagenome]|uniref:Uncharacterized protein n=1 Tax=marine metagenome TaxID=408172 RepID=A0A382DMF1_9ZZZZ